MIKVMFVCHGNICRSPMAEYLFKDMVNKLNLNNYFHIESRATSTEEIGNPIYYKVEEIFDRLGIDTSNHQARQITRREYDLYDYIIVMDEYNLSNIKRMFNDNSKCKLLLSFAGLNRSISDPWYTRDFNLAYNEIKMGLEGFLKTFKF
ncbi:MAG: low molecular weight phosphotyrosine protein phosphatase [Acholeplasmatales bacterium]|nr:low molecular weight phosphotyrosine protein phosphatase [Acholeplasmatales bacterium]